MKIYYFEHFNEKNHYVFEAFTSKAEATAKRQAIQALHNELAGEWRKYVIEKIRGVTKKPELQPPSVPEIRTAEFPITKDGLFQAFKFFKGGRNADSRRGTEVSVNDRS